MWEHLRDIGLRGNKTSTAMWKRLREERFAKIDELMELDRTPNEIANTIGASQVALSRQGYRHGRDDIGRFFDEDRNKNRRR